MKEVSLEIHDPFITSLGKDKSLGPAKDIDQFCSDESKMTREEKEEQLPKMHPDRDKSVDKKHAKRWRTAGTSDRRQVQTEEKF